MRAMPIWLAVAIVGLTEAAQAQVVQLPSYHYFGVQTVVSVPDRGSVYLGGVSRARSASAEYGVPLLPFRNRAMGIERSAIGTSVTATIHDFQAMDEAILRGGRQATAPLPSPTLADHAFAQMQRRQLLLKNQPQQGARIAGR